MKTTFLKSQLRRIIKEELDVLVNEKTLPFSNFDENDFKSSIDDQTTSSSLLRIIKQVLKTSSILELTEEDGSAAYKLINKLYKSSPKFKTFNTDSADTYDVYILKFHSSPCVIINNPMAYASMFVAA